MDHILSDLLFAGDTALGNAVERYREMLHSLKGQLANMFEYVVLVNENVSRIYECLKQANQNIQEQWGYLPASVGTCWLCSFRCVTTLSTSVLISLPVVVIGFNSAIFANIVHEQPCRVGHRYFFIAAQARLHRLSVLATEWRKPVKAPDMRKIITDLVNRRVPCN